MEVYNMKDMSKTNKILINKIFNELKKGDITLEECEEAIIKEIERVEDIWESELDNMADLLQNRE